MKFHLLADIMESAWTISFSICCQISESLYQNLQVFIWHRRETFSNVMFSNIFILIMHKLNFCRCVWDALGRIHLLFEWLKSCFWLISHIFSSHPYDVKNFGAHRQPITIQPPGKLSDWLGQPSWRYSYSTINWGQQRCKHLFTSWSTSSSGSSPECTTINTLSPQLIPEVFQETTRKMLSKYSAELTKIVSVNPSVDSNVIVWPRQSFATFHSTFPVLIGLIMCETMPQRTKITGSASSVVQQCRNCFCQSIQLKWHSKTSRTKDL